MKISERVMIFLTAFNQASQNSTVRLSPEFENYQCCVSEGHSVEECCGSQS
jgi:hypothetical protein